MSFCYPKGNFGRNQLLDGSISLSPLYLTINLHVGITTSLHHSFLWLHSIRACFTIFWGPRYVLYRRYRRLVRALVPLHDRGPNSLCARDFHPNTCGCVGLLGLCFKTGRLKPFCQHPKQVMWAKALTPKCMLSSSIPPLAMWQETITFPRRDKTDADPSSWEVYQAETSTAKVVMLYQWGFSMYHIGNLGRIFFSIWPYSLCKFYLHLG